jgi:hypothetical protein
MTKQVNTFKTIAQPASASLGIPTGSVLLMHFDGTNGSTTFTDVYGHAFTIGGGTPTISTTQSMFGGASLNLNGSSYIKTSSTSADFSLPSDFTLEGFFWPNNGGSSGIVTTDASNNGLQLMVSSAGGVNVETNGFGGSLRLSAGSVSNATWTHVAAVKHSGTVTIYVAGSSVASGADSYGSSTPGAMSVYFGANRLGGGFYTGFIDEARISTVARYTSNFTPPSSPFTS